MRSRNGVNTGDPWTCFGDSALRLQDEVTSEQAILTVAAAPAASA